GDDLTDDECGQGDGGRNSQTDDEARIEPVLALTPIEQELKRAESHYHQEQSGKIEARRLLGVGRVEQENARGDEAYGAERQVDVEDPAPRPVVGDPSPQR